MIREWLPGWIGCSFIDERRNRMKMRKFLPALLLCVRAISAAGDPAESRIDAMLADIARTDWGGDRAVLIAFSDTLRSFHGSPEKLAGIQNKMTRILLSPAPPAAKQYICQELGIMGDGKAIPALTALAKDSACFDMALSAIERIPGQEAEKSLLKLLSGKKGRMRVGIVNALGNRQTPGAIPSLKKLVPGEDPEAAVAAVTALGKIADDASVQVLRKIFDSAQEPLRSYTAEALLRCADRRLEAGRMEEAADLYRIFTGGKEPDPLRTAATIGLLRSAQDRSGLMVPILKGDDDAAKSAAISLIPEFSELDVAPVASEMPKLSNNHKIQMLSALAELGKRAAMPVILEMSLHEDPEVRLSALKAIGVLGDENSVLMLAEKAAGSQGVEKEAARRSLASIPVQEADSLILAEIPKAGIPLKIELIRSIETRRMRSATPVLIACLSDTDKKVRMESYRSLSETADPEFLSGLMEVLISVEEEAERREASKALAMTGSRMDTGRRTALLLERYPSVKNPQARAPMLEVLGKWGDDSGLPLLKSELGSKHAEIRTSAVRALSDWPNGAPMPELLSTVKTSRDDVNRILALRGYIRLAGTGERPCAQAMQDYRTALGLASEANEKRQVLSGIARLSCEEAASMAFECMNNPELEAEAGAAVIQISLNLVETDFTGAAKLLERLERETRDEETKHRAAEILERMKE